MAQAATEDDILEEEAADDVFISFAPDVQAAIEKVLPSKDPLDRPDFNTIDYINSLFPTEQSLSNIDDVVAKMQEKINTIDSEISVVVRGQSTVSQDGRQALDEAQKVIKLLFLHIKDIKERAEKSEEMVREITRDIKQLDCAKRNLTLAITTLNHLHMLVGGVESLRLLTQKRQYGDIALPLQAITEVMRHFHSYTDIPQIKSLGEQVRAIELELAEQITKEFHQAFANNSKVVVPNKQLAQGCLVVSILEPRVKRDLLKWFVNVQLEEYSHLFQETEDTAWLDKIDKRYAWIKRHLLEFEERLGTMFPQNWEVSERLTVQFCHNTREDLTKLMEKRRHEIDVKLLLYAIQKTSAFESLLARRFTGITLSELTIQKLPAETKEEEEVTDLETSLKMNPFIGLVGKCFIPHLNIYIDSVRKNLSELIDRFVQDEKSDQQHSSSMSGSESVVLPSCGQLFVFYKKSMIQCSQLDYGQSLLDMSRLFQMGLREYAQKLLQCNLPRAGETQQNTSSLGSSVQSLRQDLQSKIATSGLIQNVRSSLLTNAREGDAARLTREELVRVCCILTTAEYCYETTTQLEEKLREKILPEFVDRVDFGTEQKCFTGVIANCIQFLVQDFNNACEPPLVAMSKIQWQNITSVGDQSPYITSIRSHLHSTIPVIRDSLASSRKYFTQFCVRFADEFIRRFIAGVYKCKPIGTEGAEQLLLDTHTLKTVLLALPTAGSEVGRPPPPSYTKVVHKEIGKAEMILKVVMTPIDPAKDFIDHYLKLLPTCSQAEFTKVLEMKSVRRQEQTALIDLFRSIRPSVTTSGDAEIGANDIQDGGNSAAVAASGSIRKLEKMIKKKLPS